MALTPDEVETKVFVRVLRGYDPNEVMSFLRVIADEMRKRDQDAPVANDDEVTALLRAAYETARKRGSEAAPATRKSPNERQRERPLRVASR
jgi:DivIVA domain-containing protein